MSSIVGQYLSPLFVQEAPAGAINGSNTAFVLSFTPAGNQCVQLSLDGVVLTLTLHYTLSGVNITMVDAPSLGQNLQAQYLKA